MQIQIILLVAHAASQIVGRWIPCKWSRPTDEVFEFYQSSLIFLSEDDIEDFILEDGFSESPNFPWIKRVRVKFPDIARMIAKAIISQIEWMKNNDGGCVLISDLRYPEILRGIAKPPLAMFYVGNLDCLALPKISIIGSRQANFLAMSETMKLGAMLSKYSCTVISGGAIGCDIAVHCGMLSSLNSIVNAGIVFAGGLGSLYPRRNEDIFLRVVNSGGLLLSERFWWQSSQPKDFPIRNRIVAGLAPLLIVMQAGDKSGALITAQEAIDEGRDVYVLRHVDGDVRAAGGARLLEDGAFEFDNAEELVSLLSGAVGSKSTIINRRDLSSNYYY